MKLAETPFRDLLPSSVRDDPRFAAAAAALDEAHNEIQALIPNVLIWSRIDELDEPLLSTLAWQLHLDAYEGWPLAQTLEQKRALIKNAIILHYFKGTRYSLERVFDLLDMSGSIVEWWESGEPIEDFPPYTFDININANRTINEHLYDDMDKLINALKNVRSHRRKIKINNAPPPVKVYVAGAMTTGVYISIGPPLSATHDIDTGIPKVAGALESITTITVGPGPEDGENI